MDESDVKFFSIEVRSVATITGVALLTVRIQGFSTSSNSWNEFLEKKRYNRMRCCAPKELLQLCMLTSSILHMLLVGKASAWTVIPQPLHQQRIPVLIGASPSPLVASSRNQRVAHRQRASSPTGSSNDRPQEKTTKKIKVKVTAKDNKKKKKRSWLQPFLMAGSRGTNKVILREAPELGGVARSDRYSSRDWLHNTISLPNSTILRNIRSPVLTITAWATALSMLHHKLLQTKGPAFASHLYLSPIPHSLMMSALGLLLVFRTNSAYQRFAEGRKIWEQIINSARDLYRMLMLYSDQIGTDKRRRLQRLLAAFPYLLRHRIRPNLVMHRLDDEQYERDPENTILLYQDAGPKEDDEEAAVVARDEEETGKSRRRKRLLFWVDKRTLPWRLLPPGALEKCASSQNRPLWVRYHVKNPLLCDCSY